MQDWMGRSLLSSFHIIGWWTCRSSVIDQRFIRKITLPVIFNPRMYMQIYAPTMVQGGMDETLP